MGDPFQALATPVRRFILETLAGAEVCAGEFAEHVQMHFGIGWPAVTKNLRVLHRAGFVRARDADDVIDQIMLEEGFDPLTGKPLAEGVRATREIE